MLQRTRVVVFVGVVCVDEILDLDAFPKEDSKVRATNRSIGRGGNAGNSAAMLARLLTANQLGGLVHICSVIGDDAEGLMVRDTCAKDNVQTGTLVVANGQLTPKSIVLRVKDTRTIVHYRTLAELNFEQFVSAIARVSPPISTSWFHFEGRNTNETLKMMETIDSSVLSLELERRRSCDEHNLLLTSPRLVVFAHEFMESFGHHSVRSFVEGFLLLNGYGPKEYAWWVFTFGSRGSVGVEVTRNELRSLHLCPAERIENVTNTLGAGDAFLSGLIYAVSFANLKLEAALVFASHVAAQKIRGLV